MKMPQWSIEVITDRQLEPETMVLFSMIPMEEESNLVQTGKDFWEDVKVRLLKKIRLYDLPSSVAEAYIKDARRNPGNRIALLLKY